MDPLVELPLEKWPELQKKLKTLWHLNVAGYYALHLYMNYPKVREAFKFKVFCPFGDINNGFVATDAKGPSLFCIIFPVSENTTKLEEALVKTGMIDWGANTVCIDLVSSCVLRILNKIKPAVGWTKYLVGRVNTYLLEQNTPPFENLRCPPNTYLAPVTEENIKRVDDSWPYKYPASDFYFSILASNGLSYGLYSIVGDLLAWLFVNEYNFLLHLYCDERCRRKGYGEYLMKYVINKQLESGNDVYSYIAEGNEKSARLFRKLGFNTIDESAYLYVRK